ncbi:lipopolysaccharide biosynthesis protein [Sphingobium bisphenolivorans]|uniref:lipopolysaccharide biosynthesis protein n=1 Tax=Sphingobium bisphenolivorans TaxID=1335760 RepID=UPI002379ECE1|nr:lipopolysaccharide biosynthesis protein [Sphingobium bisphenolivorans]
MSKLVEGSLWATGARAMVNCLGLVSTLLLARLLTPADFGIVAIATVLQLIIAAVTNLSLAEALIQHEDPQPRHFDTVWTLGVLRSALAAAVYALAAPWVARAFGEPRLEPVMAVLALGIFLTGLANPRRVMMQKKLIFWQDFMLKVGEKLTAVIVTVTIALLFRSYWALVWGVVAGQLAHLLISYSILPYRPRPGLSGARMLFGFSVWLTLGQVVNTINWRFDQLLVGKFIGPAALGLYTVGDNLAVMPTREATQPLTETLYPAFAQLSREPDRLRSAYQSAQALVTATALPLGIGMALLARPLVLAAMGQKWEGAVLVIQGLASIFALQTLGALAQPLAMALGRTRSLFNRDAVMFCVRLPIIIGGIAAAGLPGLIAGRIVAGLIAMIFNMTLVRGLIALPLGGQVAANRRALLSVAAMALAVLACRHMWEDGHSLAELLMTILLQVTLGALVYCGTSVLLWRLAGQPPGPESDVKRVLLALVDRVRPHDPRLQGTPR